MFQWDKSINSVAVPADKVVHLFRSMREVQLALPGIPAQQASAYLCQHRQDGGVATVAAFHLHKSEVLAFYYAEPRVVPEEDVDSMLDQGLNFVESMGFLLTDQDIHLLDTADQEMLWESLPLKAGILVEDGTPAAAEPVKKSVEKTATETTVEKAVQPEVKPQKEAVRAVSQPEKTAPVAEVIEGPVVNEEDEAEAAENVNDLLAAVEAMRAKRPGLRARKSAPSPEEVHRRKEELRENVGRILASL